MTLEFALTILDLPKLPNATLYRHWRVKQREAQKWKLLVATACRDAGISNLRLTSVALSYERWSAREPDFDSLVASFKHAQDGLVIAGVLVDDKSSVIGQPSYKWIKEKQKLAKVVIRIARAA